MTAIFSRPLPRLIAVVGLQFLVLLSIIAFKQYTVATADKVVLATTITNPSTLVGGDHFNTVEYEISVLDPARLEGENPEDLSDKVYVELAETDTGVWEAVAIHDDHERMSSGTVLIAARIEYVTSYPNDEVRLHYGIEDIYIPESAAESVPSGSGHEVHVEVRIDRFGHADALRFVIDGVPVDLAHR